MLPRCACISIFFSFTPQTSETVLSHKKLRDSSFVGSYVGPLWRHAGHRFSTQTNETLPHGNDSEQQGDAAADLLLKDRSKTTQFWSKNTLWRIGSQDGDPAAQTDPCSVVAEAERPLH